MIPITVYRLLKKHSFGIDGTDKEILIPISLSGKDKEKITSNGIRFIQMTDPHVHSEWSSQRVRKVVSEINKWSVDFVVSTGDNVYHGWDRKQIGFFRKSI